ncbi:MAG: pyrroloquinoline quinone-dependent dehydrogenase [Proteobacteria bacterium]|nr:pyrroloquinoline quinone-dependent dehydrogenase [Pseudomonadota bacterium]
MTRFALAFTTATLLLACSDSAPVDLSGPLAQWPDYGGDKGGLNWSPLTQIDTANVGDLEVAWVHHSGDFSDGSGEITRTSLQVRPIVVDDTLYYCTPFNRVFALDPETGEERWVFDPELVALRLSGPYNLTCRGVAYWAGSGPSDLGTCRTRIFTATMDSELIALDAATGVPCADFGENGRVALREGIGEAPVWEYYSTSPPLVIRDLVVIGALVADNLRVDAPSGVVRGFDARTGALRWAWDPVPPGWDPEASLAESGRRYQGGTPNVWSILSGDPERGLVFVPMGNASPDMFAALRLNLDFYASSTGALRAVTGEVAWHFQTVHTDVWDYDVPAQPALFQIEGVGGGVPAAAQITKMGHLFLLHRETGEPLYPVEERPVPQSDVPGEVLSPTQPFPTHVPPLHPTEVTPENAWGFSFIDRGDCAERIAGYRSEGLFTPPSLRGSIQYPGNAGGPNWGGVSIDPGNAILYVNQMRAAAVVTLVPRAEFETLDLAAAVFPNELYPMEGTPYGMRREPLLSSFGAPCVPPPWGTLTAVDLRAGEILWEARLGTTRDVAPWPLWFDNGAPNLGGSLATAGGVVFIGATTDKFFRAFDAATGEETWTERIPYTANASPISYRLRPDGRQFVVIAAGGHGWSEPGDALLAFALP